jgi:phospholipid/cholesterol/gamma-HCH transport system substrate-binding protein
MSRTTLDLWVGIFVVMGALALAFLATQVGSASGLSGGAMYSVEAPFDNIGGLKVKAPVKSAGVLVGRVAGIHFDSRTYRAVVRLDLDPRYTFPRDTIATILTAGLLGEQYVGLEPGDDENMLQAGDRIAMTQSAVVLEKLIGQFMFNKAAETPARD